MATDIANRDAAGKAALLSFEGRASEAIRIASVNAILQLLTLGVYRFWARTRYRKFLWRETHFLGEPLEYSGRGLHLFVGFITAIVLIGAISGALNVGALLGGDVAPFLVVINGVLIYLLLEFGIYRARAYRLGHTAWRGIRFGQTGLGVRYALTSFGCLLLVVLTLGIVKPWMDATLFRLRWSNTWFGDRRFEVLRDGSGGWRWWFALYVPLVANAVIGVINKDAGANPPLWATIAGLACYALIAVAYSFFRIEQFRHFAGDLRLGRAWLASTLRAKDLAGPAVVYAVLVIAVLGAVSITLGFLWADAIAGGGTPEPDTLALVLSAVVVIVGFNLIGVAYNGFVVPRVVRHLAATLAFHGDLEIEGVAQSDRPVPGAGEGLAGVLDVGVSV